MVDEVRAKTYCKDDISKIENYDLAKNDKENSWVCHHRLEITLDGDHANSPVDLKRHGMYYNRPYFELIFLSRSEHQGLHNKTRTGEKNPNYGKTHTLSAEARRNMSEAAKGRTSPNKGKTCSEETRKKISEAGKAAWAKRKEGGK